MTITPQRPDTAVEVDLRTAGAQEHLDAGLRAIVERICNVHPEVDARRAVSLVIDAHARTEHATVQNYRLLLAERSVRDILRRERRSTTGGTTEPARG
jgi:hypothetical protein